jgi:raffinose/stachyose/melibiose transport system permease protein
MYLPVLILLGVFLFFPFIKGLLISFTDWDGFGQYYHWVGLQKYILMFQDPKMIGTLKNTLVYGVGSTILQNIIGLAIALFLDQKLKLKGIVRTIVYLPVIISQFIMGYIWYFFFQYNGGVINDLLSLFKQAPVDWLASGARGVAIITAVNTFQYLGVAMIIFLAGLQSIPTEFYEVAAIDGATPFQTFKSVTIPYLMPSITVSVVMNIIGGLKLYDVIMAMTGGGPGYSTMSLSTMMYNLYFLRQDAGYATALGNVMFLMITIISITMLRYLRNKEVEL